MTKHCCKHRVSAKLVFKGISLIIIPLFISISTLIITLQQNRLGEASRANEFEIAQKQREQDLLLANQTRQQDREFEKKRHEHEDELSEKQRQDQILAEYLRETTQFLLSQSANIEYDILQAILRPRTLITFRQLNVKRKTYIVHFLYELKLLTVGENTLGLEGANLDGLEFGIPEQNHSAFILTLHELALSGVSLINATFDNRHMLSSDFHEAQMEGASFQGANLPRVNFYGTYLRNAKFGNANLHQADFTHADLTGSDLSYEQLFEQAISLDSAILPDGVTRGRPLNLFFNGDAELGSTTGWNVSARTEIVAQKYSNETKEEYGQWYFQLTNSTRQISISQHVDLRRYVPMIERSAARLIISVDVKPINTIVKIHLKTFDLHGNEFSNVIEFLHGSENDTTIMHATGSFVCRPDITAVEVEFIIIYGEIFDNLRMSIRRLK